MDSWAWRLSQGDGSASQERLTLETVLTAPEWLGLTTATPMQRAICRLADGLPLAELWSSPLLPPETDRAYPDEVRARSTLHWALGGDVEPDGMPRELDVLAGIRGGKSLIASAVAIKASQTCDLGALQPWEVPRYSICSLSLDNAHVIFEHLAGACQHSPRVAELVCAEPTADSVYLRHPSGRPVEVKVVAGRRAGGSLVSRWLIGAAFDEAPRMVGAEDGVVNLDDLRKAALERLLPGGQLLYIGSPWAPLGPVYRAVTEHHGRPSRTHVVVRATGPAMNPHHWTPERTNRSAAPPPEGDPQVYLTDCLAEFADLESSLFTDAQLRAITVDGCQRLPYEPWCTYVAYMDTATRSNAWTLVIGALRRDGTCAIVYATQWLPGVEALRPKKVLSQVKAMCDEYACPNVFTDQFGGDFVVDLGAEIGLTVTPDTVTRKSKNEEWATTRARVLEKTLTLIDAPQLIEDLKRVRKRLTPDGHTIEFPTTQDGRHCDYAPAVAGVVSRCIVDAAPEEQPLPPAEQQRAASRLLVKKQQSAGDRDVYLYDIGDEGVIDDESEGEWALEDL